jgi:hypothetical protein
MMMSGSSRLPVDEHTLPPVFGNVCDYVTEFERKAMAPAGTKQRVENKPL